MWSFLIAHCHARIFFFETSNLPSSCLRWETTHTAPLRMATCTWGDSTITTSLYWCGMPLCRLAMGTEPQSISVGSMRSTACNATQSTSISCPTPCFLMGAHDPRGLSRLTWMMLWKRLLTWHSPPCARRIWLVLQACPSCYILSRTALTQSGRLAWMRWATSFRFTTTVAGHTCVIATIWLNQKVGREQDGPKRWIWLSCESAPAWASGGPNRPCI
jgi:hypothetical protein